MRALVLALCFVLAACASAAPSSPQLDAASSARIDAILEQQRLEQHIPGLSFLIVRDGEIVYARAFGQRDIEQNLPATLDTVFPIGSATKPFTSMAVALSQDAGLLSLDEHPRRLLPYFRMRDPASDAQVTLRDMLSHQTGLRAYADLAAEPAVLTREEYLRATIAAAPAFPLRTRFQYSNAMITAAGEAAAHANGMSWEQLIEARIFAPLGMNDSIANVRDMGAAPDHATGYVYDAAAQSYAPTPPPRSLDALAPAGSIASSANDMARWLIMLSDGGAFQGRRFVSAAAFADMTTPKIAISDQLSYGLAWATYDWNGRHVVEHNGGSQGISALVSFIPERRIGFVFLANTSPNFMTHITNAGNLIYPILLGAPAGEAPVVADATARPELAEPASAPSVDLLLARIVRAAGGARALRRHTSLVIEASKSYDNQGVAGPLKIYARAPASRAEEEVWRAADREIGRFRFFFDGAIGGQETSFGQDETNDAALNASWRRLHDFRSLLNLRQNYSEIAAGADEEIEGEPVYMLSFGNGGEVEETLYVSVETGRVLRRAIAATSYDYSDYRSVDGEMVPYRITIDDALGKTTIIVNSARFNEAIADSVFAPRR